MTTLREAATQALEALESLFNWQVDPERGKRCGDAVVALRAALADGDKLSPGEPVARLFGTLPVYDTPPQRKPLSEEELSKIIDAEIGFNSCVGWEEGFARAIERAHGIV